jgi:hypothetical protein
MIKKRSPELFEASYSVLSTWERGNWDDAIRMYFHLDFEPSEAMKQGKMWHEKFSREVQETGCHPKIFGGQKINGEFQVELRIEKKLDDWLQLNGVIDLKTDGTIIDYKTGVSSPSVHFKQLKVYQIFYPKSEDANLGIIRHFNQYSNKAESVYYHLNQKTLRDGYNWLITNASEMYQYLEENNIYKKIEKGEIL